MPLPESQQSHAERRLNADSALRRVLTEQRDTSEIEFLTLVEHFHYSQPAGASRECPYPRFSSVVILIKSIPATLRRSVLTPVLLAGSVLCAGCQSLELSNEEIAWQTLHAVDIAQTLSAAQDPCYVEDAYVTRRLIGSQPSSGEVLLWGAGMAVGHAFVTNMLEKHHAPRWVQKTWSYATITGTGIAIASNHAEGVRVFGDNESVDGCYES